MQPDAQGVVCGKQVQLELPLHAAGSGSHAYDLHVGLVGSGVSTQYSSVSQKSQPQRTVGVPNEHSAVAEISVPCKYALHSPG
jgi:hypothetical protein